MTMAVQLRVIIEEHDIRKLTLPSEIPNRVEELIYIVCSTLNVHEEFRLLYQDIDFGNQFFSLTSTAELHDKATVKIIRTEPLINLDLHPVADWDNNSGREFDAIPGHPSHADHHTSSCVF